MSPAVLSATAPSLRHHTAPHPAPWRDLDHIGVEICLENVAGVRLAVRAGADRAELCDNLTVGGTTPSIGAVEAAILAAAEEVEAKRQRIGAYWASSKDGAPFGLRIMIRPRGGGFIYDGDGRRAMIADVRRIAALAREMSEYTRPVPTSNPAQPLPPAVDLGIVVGGLTDDGAVDRGLIRLLKDLADGATLTYHRAIDASRDPLEAYRDLRRLGVDYVLTSGAADTALDGARTIAAMVAEEGPRVIATGTVRSHNAAEVIAATGAREIHLRCSFPDLPPHLPQNTDEEQVREIVEVTRALPVPGGPGRSEG
ncbi:copper homeostasis protein CutC [Actinomyces sp. Chiba101]|uniref:Copper homeostasis protein cutC homolog n=1 Tax=Actinomyces denticolens TaxID=52767 RepID=A0ABY1IJC2_9ACTO|nr:MULTISPECIES: copper homeostasis protein CutC [Actinomyces]BAW92168.1 copper homeostasis protein CutC [Actinomyces sp. Chiba101]GAV94894.1 copper homeostasis protein CutC [Actinomyces denticolens]SHJ26046.1 copper homeostasis protein [Actinomyces denticolens]SUU10902.1 Copper homeostasis protein CutC [Actinomyces denticolens]